jgi:von Willebrand factor type D domain
MKLFQQVFVILSLSGVTAVASKKLIAECKTECDEDSQCMPGLLCADRHEIELRAAGLDIKKAYCGNVGKPNYEVCYDPKKIGKVTGPIVTKAQEIKSGLCQADCDLDIDCAPGLWCADEHHVALKAAGFDTRKANCNVENLPWNHEVCFDPKILDKTGGGGGDPHFRTYDGTMYSYHGQCDLVMARSQDFGSNLGLDLHIRTEIVTGWSLISNSAIRIGEDVFELSNDGSYYFNGAKDVELPVHLAGRYEVMKSVVQIEGKDSDNEMFRSRFEIKLDGKESITMTLFRQMISVKVNAILSGTEGMLGMHGIDGMVGRDHVSIFSDPNEMGTEWQVDDSEPMLFHDIRAPQFPETCILPSVSSRRLRMADRRRAEEACAGVETGMIEFCIEDVMVTGDQNIVHSYGF